MPCDNPKLNSPVSSDLTTVDWLLFSTEKMIKRINPNIVVNIVKNVLLIKNININDLKELSLYTHNNTNNNYLSLIRTDISLNNGVIINLPGLNDIIKEIYKNEDNIANSEDKKLFKPFVNLDKLVDDFTYIIPTYPNLAGQVKYYSFTFTAA